MKKLVASLLAATTLLSLAACGASDAEPTDGQTSFTEDTETEIVSETTSDSKNPFGDQDNFIHTLTPTHTITTDWPFEQVMSRMGDLWLPGQDLKDLSHLTNGRYEVSFTSQYLDEHNLERGDYFLTWEELKELKLSDFNSPKFDIHCDDFENNGIYSGIEVTFNYDDDNDVNGVGDLTVEEAIDQGYWKYSFMYANNALSLDDIYVTPSDYSAPFVETIVSEWGMPSEVYYDPYKNEGLSKFALVYETESCFILLDGYACNSYGNMPEPEVRSVYTYGKNVQPFDGYFDMYDIKFE